ncbi:MAG: AMP-binding protein, partial [Myxococcota bacterium]
MAESAPHADSQTLDLIAKARCFFGRPLDEAQLPFKHVGDLIDRQAGSLGAHPYLIAYRDDGGGREEISYGDFRARVNALAADLSGRLGVRKGDRVATLLVNEPETVLVYFAALKAGAVVVPINVDEEPARVRFILEHSRARALVARADAAAKGAEAGAGLENLAARAQIGGTPAPGFTSLDIPADPPATSSAGPPDLSFRDEALIVYTSGTTAEPKG